MEKRIFVAVLISIAFLWAWGALAPRFFPQLAQPRVEQKQPAEAALATPGTSPSPAPASATQAPQPVLEASPSSPAPSTTVAVQAAAIQESVVETPQYIARFSNRGAQLRSFQLKEYRDDDGDLVDLVKSRPAASSDFPFAVESADGRLTRLANTSRYLVDETVEGAVTTLTFRYRSDRGEEISKVFRLGPAYQFEFDVRLTGSRVPYRVVIGPGIRTIDPASQDTQFLTTGNGVTQIDDSLDVVGREKAPSLQVFDERVSFIGIEDNYFLVALKPAVSGSTLFRSVLLPAGPNIEEGRKEIYAAVNSVDGRVAGRAFFGPKQAEVLEAYGLEKTLKFGWFGLIGRFLLTALIWFYSYIGNYGWAIVALTVVIKIILYPLQHKAIVSMKKMQKVQPKVNALKDKYKKAKTDADQRQKMNTEMMKLYQQEGINPMSGCLPILLQLPILWAFYGLLSNAIELRGAEFILWIRDLSAPDPYYITPILMTVTMFIQQWMTPTTLDPVQKKIFMVLPLVFGFIFKDFPSGLVLYWLVQNVLTIIQQGIMNRYWKDHPLEVSK